MSKSDKELAVEVAIAVINANPRIKHSKTGTGVEGVVPSLSLESVENIIKSCYNTIKGLN